MKLKICSKCKKEYFATREFFYANKNRPGGLEYRCKKCACLKTILWNKANGEKVKENKRKSYLRHKEEINLKSKRWREANPERHKENNKRWVNQNKEYHAQSRAEWHKTHLERDRESARRHAEKRSQNAIWRISNNISRGMNRSLKDGKQRCHWEEFVGYKIIELKNHIKKQFQPGMTWENYGEWHIDHRIPISAFNFNSSNHIDFKKCWALANLRPLWKHDNIVKRNKLNHPFQPSLAIAY